MTFAGQGQVPVDTLLGQQARRPSKWQTLLAWRNWRLPVKLAAIILVPILLAVTLGTIGIVTISSSAIAGAATGAIVALAVVLAVGLVLAACVGYLISKQLLDSLHQLRSSAIDIAHDQLPAVVQSLQQGERAGDTEVAPVPVHGADEVGQVARAFDEVHGQAVRLAADQAAMRSAYGNVFVNLSRRSQSLVQRQLQLIERLERDEEDADQLATLFQLDHLATRMRRNNENLLVLSGGESGRRSGQPVTVTDVLRAAVSEIEQYQRVAVKTAPDSRVVGHAASDLMRLIAELLDNATAFSAPETHVTLATRLTDDRSLSIDVIDKGIGMSAAEVGDANARMAEAASMDLATSRRMGLFVVGRLASKHGFHVTIHGGRDITGVRANVLIPAGLLAGGHSIAPMPPQQPPAADTAGDGAGAPGAPAALPRRTRPVNGSAVDAAVFSAKESLLSESSDKEPPASANEVSGTALFTPIGSEEPPAEGEQEQTEPAQPAAAPSEAEQAGTGPAESEHVETEHGEVGRADAEPAEIEQAETEHVETEQTGANRVEAEQAETERGGDDLPSGKALFASNGTPLTQWWTAATRANDAAERASRADAAGTNSASETTPIFNEMLSAWFRAASPPEDRSTASESTTANTGWDFAADNGRRTVESVSRTEPKSYTTSGLPRRRKGEQLLPGSAAENGYGSPDAAESGRAGLGRSSAGGGQSRKLPVRDPADVRGRLSSFQRGVYQGRRQRPSEGAPVGDPARAGESTPAGEAVTVEWPTSTEVPAQPEQRRADEQADEQADQHVDQPVDQQADQHVDQPVDQKVDRRADQVGEDWSFASDASLREVRSVAGSQPSSYTDTGLPRRRRGEKLLPGSASRPESVPGPRTERDPETVRGRLSSFQQGVRRGRHQSMRPTDGQPADGTDNHEHMEGE